MSNVLGVGEYKGLKYRQMTNHSIEVDTEDGTVTYPDLSTFRNEVRARLPG
jgi:hypothetical protein